MTRFAIIIPTHKRQAHVNSIVEYYLVSGFNGKIYVIDSSPQLNPELSQKKEIEYLHYPDVPMTKKIGLGLEKVNQEFCLLNADDDYYSVDFLRNATQILSESKKYSCVYGVNYGYIAHPTVGIKTFPIAYHCLKSYALSDDLSERILEHFRFYDPLMYVVMRASVLKEAYNILNEQNIANYNLQEFVITTANLLNGKPCFLPRTFCFRESVIDSEVLVGNKEDVLRKDIPELISDNDYNYLKTVKALAHYNSTVDPGSSQDQNSEIINKGFNEFVKVFIPFMETYKIKLSFKNKLALRFIKWFSSRGYFGLKPSFYDKLTAYEMLTVALLYYEYDSHFNPANTAAEKEVLGMIKVWEQRIKTQAEVNVAA